MWSYYGSKSKIVDYYPKPKFGKIIEPFAGSARYSLKHFDNEILLVDKNPSIISIWEYLQQCSIKDILSLPVLPAYHRIKREDFDCDGQYLLMRFMIVQAAYGGNNVVSKFGSMRFKSNVKSVARNLFKIKHWKFLCDSYENLPKGICTWFIDPPYQHGGHKYPMSNRKINFDHLAQWCRSLKGQVIVCENTKAQWLPFSPMISQKGIKHRTTEAIWANEPTVYDNKQLQLIA